MAGGPVLVPAGKEGVVFNSKMTAYVWFVCILGGCGGLLLGYDNGVIGGVVNMTYFKKKFFYSIYEAEIRFDADPQTSHNPYCKYNSQTLQLVVSSLYISALFSGLIASPFARRFGRKPVLLVAGAFFIVGAALLAVAQDVAMLVVGRVLLGVGVGLASLVMPMYNAEMAPVHMRGAMNILFQLFVTIGILAAGLINYGCQHIKSDAGWRLALGLGAIPGIIVFIGGIVLPESPSSLCERGHPEQARRVLERIRGVSDVQAEFDDIVEAAHASNLVKNPMRNLFSAKYRPQLVISLVFMLFQQFAGINAIIFYAPILFSSIGTGDTAALLNTVIIGAVNVLSTIVAVVLVDRVGRKALLIEGCVQMIATQITVGVTLKYMFEQYGAKLPSGVSWGVLAVICVYIAGFAWSWGPIGWLYPTEIQPLETRAAGASLNVASNMLFTFIIAQCFVTMLCTMKWGVFLFFSGFLVIMMLFVIFLLPETKGHPLEDVFRLFQKHPFWNRVSAIEQVHLGTGLPYHKGAAVDDGMGKPVGAPVGGVPVVGAPVGTPVSGPGGAGHMVEPPPHAHHVNDGPVGAVTR